VLEYLSAPQWRLEEHPRREQGPRRGVGAVAAEAAVNECVNCSECGEELWTSRERGGVCDACKRAEDEDLEARADEDVDSDE
jgi:hypothetical protein